MGARAARSARPDKSCLGVEVRIVDAEGRELPRGEVGEIAVLSPRRHVGGTGTSLKKPHRLCAGTPTRAGCTPATAAVWIEEGFVFVVDRVTGYDIISGG